MSSWRRFLHGSVALGVLALASACTSDEDGGGGATGAASTGASGGSAGSAASAGSGGSGLSAAGGGGTGGSPAEGGGGAGGRGAGGDGGVAIGGMGGSIQTGGTGGTGGAGGVASGGTGTGGTLDCGALTNCGGVCVDLTSDPSHCGACGTVCAVVAACQASTCACGTVVVSLSAGVQPILNSHCSDCHLGPNSPQGLDLAPGSTWGDTVGVAASECNGGRLRVAPGDPANSYLMDKLLGVDLCQGDSMPKNGAPLSASELQTISDWICQGAPNN